MIIFGLGDRMKKFDQRKYGLEYHRENYKQLSVKIPIKLKEEFDKVLKENSDTARQVIIGFIKDYIKNKTK